MSEEGTLHPNKELELLILPGLDGLEVVLEKEGGLAGQVAQKGEDVGIGLRVARFAQPDLENGGNLVSGENRDVKDGERGEIDHLALLGGRVGSAGFASGDDAGFFLVEGLSEDELDRVFLSFVLLVEEGVELAVGDFFKLMVRAFDPESGTARREAVHGSLDEAREELARVETSAGNLSEGAHRALDAGFGAFEEKLLLLGGHVKSMTGLGAGMQEERP